MKKITVIILMLVYGLSSSGTTVTADYCCGKLSKIGVSLNETGNSKQDNQLANKKCCGHKEVSFKIKADHQPTAKQSVDFSTQSFVQPAFFTVVYNLDFLNQTVLQYSTGPPLFTFSNLFLTNCSFRI